MAKGIAGALVILVGVITAVYCGINSLSILREKNPNEYPIATLFVLISLFGLALLTMGGVIISQVVAEYKTLPPPPPTAKKK